MKGTILSLDCGLGLRRAVQSGDQEISFLSVNWALPLTCVVLGVALTLLSFGSPICKKGIGSSSQEYCGD